MLTERIVLALLPIVLVTALLGQDDQWRSRNDRGNRYEGTKSVKVHAANIVSMIGFHAYRHDFKPADRISLGVTLFVGGDASRTAKLTAREINRREFYWMEAKPRLWTRGWNTFEPWPVGDILRRLRIDSTNLAVLFELDDRRIEPVFIRATKEPVMVQEYQAYFIAGKRLDKVEYRLTTAGGTVIKTGALGAKPALVPFTIKLPVSNVPAAAMRLELTCNFSGGSVHRVFEFHHQPRSPAN